MEGIAVLKIPPMQFAAHSPLGPTDTVRVTWVAFDRRVGLKTGCASLARYWVLYCISLLRMLGASQPQSVDSGSSRLVPIAYSACWWLENGLQQLLLHLLLNKLTHAGFYHSMMAAVEKRMNSSADVLPFADSSVRL